MREKRSYVVITFHTTAEAMALEKFCRDQQVPGRLIPVPRQLSAGCGLAWRMNEADYATFQETIEDSRIEYEEIAKLLL